MDENIKNLFGSLSRDIFRYAHKHLLPKSNYGGDIDFFLLSAKENKIALTLRKELVIFKKWKKEKDN